MISRARGLSGTTRKRPFLGVHFLPPTRRERVCSSTRIAPSRFGPSDASTERQVSPNNSPCGGPSPPPARSPPAVPGVRWGDPFEASSCASAGS